MQASARRYKSLILLLTLLWVTLPKVFAHTCHAVHQHEVIAETQHSDCTVKAECAACDSEFSISEVTTIHAIPAPCSFDLFSPNTYSNYTIFLFQEQFPNKAPPFFR